MQDLPAPVEVREAARRILESGDFTFSRPADPNVLAWLWHKFLDLVEALRTLPAAVRLIIMGICVLVLAAIFAHAWVVFMRSVRKSRRKGADDARRPRAEKPSSLLDAARKAAAAGDIAAALTLYMRGVLAGLDQRGLQRQIETATAHEYLGLLRRHPQERALFEQFLRFYEPGVFGRRALGGDPMNECDRLARRLAAGHG